MSITTKTHCTQDPEVRQALSRIYDEFDKMTGAGEIPESIVKSIHAILREVPVGKQYELRGCLEAIRDVLYVAV